jgi:hypothetical protein
LKFPAIFLQDARPSDGGLYECQVSYHDDVEKKLKKPIKLFVLGKYIFSADFRVTRSQSYDCQLQRHG